MNTTEIEDEIALILYCNRNRKLSYEQLISWVGTRYNENLTFQTIMNESTCISDVFDLLRVKYSFFNLTEELLLSKIACEYSNGELTIIEAVSAAYNLLNSDGDGNHELSLTLYRLVDDYESESMNQYIVRAKNSDFGVLLAKYDTGGYEKIYSRVFK